MLKSFAYVIGIEQIASEKVINDFETAKQFKDYCHVNGCYTMADFLGYKGMSREWDVYEEEYLSDANEELQMIIEKFTNKSWILQCQNSYCRENDLKLEYSERVEGLPLLMTMLKPKDVLATGYTVAMSELIGLQYSEPKSRPDARIHEHYHWGFFVAEFLVTVFVIGHILHDVLYSFPSLFLRQCLKLCTMVNCE